MSMNSHYLHPKPKPPKPSSPLFKAHKTFTIPRPQHQLRSQLIFSASERRLHDDNPAAAAPTWSACTRMTTLHLHLHLHMIIAICSMFLPSPTHERELQADRSVAVFSLHLHMHQYLQLHHHHHEYNLNLQEPALQDGWICLARAAG
ncbi:hypothetical protein KC19_2G139900 [Ceratodon purpureus]|uniref:Uncharacterized protein n=1 Tax=Ceratodon purpureus TaxID=3225 RepID=A0A8T0IW75_CERPU|nr:hypothetical protein KC19_2G139900 [Ceratodon purpureus]